MIMERVIFLTDNPLATKSFYRDVLELEIVEERDDSFTIGAGATQVTFQKTKEFARPFYHFAMNIPENKFHEAKSWLQARVTLIEEDGEDEVFLPPGMPTPSILKILPAISSNSSPGIIYPTRSRTRSAAAISMASVKSELLPMR